MYETLRQAAQECTKALEEKGDAPRELALAKLQATLRTYEELGGKEAVAIIRLSWQDTPHSRQALAKATREEL